MSNYSVKTRIRTAVPRGKRLREGAASESGSTGGSNPTGPSVGDGHTHTNKSDLDRIRVDGKYVKVYVDVEQEGETLKELEAASVGYADKAGLAEEADHAAEADNAEKWGGNKAEDYIDQPVKSTSEVIFKKVTTPEIVSPDFTTGPLGAGFRLKKGNDGSTELEVDSITVRRSLQVTELIIQQLKHQGGIVFYTAASMEISDVKAVSGGYKCYFDTKDGQIPNEFAIGDQARCQRFSLGKTVYKYYWRLVTEVGEDYVVLSSSDCDRNSGTPEKGDILVQLGNRSNTQRQSAKVTTAIGNDTPRDDYYQGINSYDLTGKLVTTVGARDGHVGIWTNDGSFAGAVSIRAGSSGLENLTEWSGFVNVLNGELQNIQFQVDGKAQTWNQDTDPSTSWDTPEEKEKHVGDLWCDTSNGNITKVYTSSYTWAAMDCVPPEIKEAIEQKANIYTTYPSETPAEGDLLIPSSDFTHAGTMYYSGQLYRYDGTAFEEMEYASNSVLAITQIEKEVWRKALQEINSSKASAVSLVKAEMTNLATVEGNAWQKAVDQGDERWYVSNCHTDGGRTVVTVTVKCYAACNMMVHIMSRGEAGFDYAVLGPLNGVLNWKTESSGGVTYYTPTNYVLTTKSNPETDCQHTFSLTPGTHTFQIAYRKDYSTSRHPDNGYFKVDNVLYAGTLAEWCALCDRNGDTERKSAAISAANALFSYMNETLHVWENVTTYMASDSFRDTMRSLFAAYYVAISKIETDVIGSDLNFLKAVFSKATTTITGGVVDTAAVVSRVAVVTDESNKPVAGMNGTEIIGYDSAHKKLMIFAGADGLPNAASSKYRVYEDGHVHASDMDMEGKVVAGSGNIGGFDIASDSLISGTYGQGSSMELHRELIRFRADDLGPRNAGVGKVSLGSNVVPASGGSTGCFMIELDSSDSAQNGRENYGAYVKVTGNNTENYAFYAENGVFGGLRPKTHVISGNITLKKTWYHLILLDSGYTITLPSSPEVGQTYELLVINGSNFTLNGGNIKIWCVHNGSSGFSMSLGGTRECWRILYANNQWIAFPYHS